MSPLAISGCAARIAAAVSSVPCQVAARRKSARGSSPSIRSPSYAADGLPTIQSRRSMRSAFPPPRGSHRVALHRAIATVGAIAAALAASGCSDEIAPPPPPPATADIAAGGQHTCRLTGTGTTAPAACWGDNPFGQRGDGSTTNSTTPVAVSGGTLRFTALAPGELHTCALTGTGAPYCWGDNIDGQLGTGSTTDSPVPVAVSGGLSLTTIAAGYGHSCGLTSARVAYCWGRNTESQLGNGAATGNSLVPGAVSGSLTFTILVAGGFLHSGAP